MSKKVQFIIWTIIAVLIIALLGWYAYSYARMKTEGNTHPEVEIEFENYGTVKFELYPEYAPNTVANFIKLAESGYYNDKVMYGKDALCLYFGRNQEGEITEPTTDTIEYPTVEPFTYSIEGEFVANGFTQNTLRHEKGVMSLIRNNYTEYFSSLYEESYNSGNSQVGIMMSDDAVNLNGVYAAFGRVVEGMDILEKMYNEAEVVAASKDDTEEAETTEATEEDEAAIKEFVNYPKVTSVKIDTHGIDYGMPKVVKAFDYTTFINNYMSSYNY